MDAAGVGQSGYRTAVTHRRRVGLIVIGVAVVLVATVAVLRPHLVTGAAQAAPIPGPPAVGDCVLDPLPPAPVAAVSTASGGTVPVYPQQTVRPCSGARYGEITAVIAAPKPTVLKNGAHSRYLDDPNTDSCYLAAPRYVGIPPQPIQSFWQTFLQIDIGLSRPSPRQEAAGQRWAACIVTLRPPDPASAPTTSTTQIPAAPRYGSSIRDALHTGQQRDQLGDCLPVLDWNDLASTGCRRPHLLELMALGDSGDHPVTLVQVGKDLSATGSPTHCHA